MEKVNIGEKNTFPPSYAKIIIECGDVGKPYRPSNGPEGENFKDEWCRKCSKSDEECGGGCDIQGWTVILSADDPAYPAEWNYRPDGQPQCTDFSPIERAKS